MFISREWTKEEHLCVDTLNHFPGCQREEIQIFFYFFSLFYFYQGKSNHGQSLPSEGLEVCEFSFKNALNPTLEDATCRKCWMSPPSLLGG